MRYSNPHCSIIVIVILLFDEFSHVICSEFRQTDISFRQACFSIQKEAENDRDVLGEGFLRPYLIIDQRTHLSLVTDYQYDVNTRNDVDYPRESLENTEAAEETVALIVDRSYASEELAEKATDKTIGLITTGLRVRKPREILTQFKLSENDHTITECPEGHTPRSNSYLRQTDSIRVSFDQCCVNGKT